MNQKWCRRSSSPETRIASAILAAGALCHLSPPPSSPPSAACPSPEEVEALRRDHLVAIGRLVDGTLVDANPTFADPAVVIYQYRIAGVTYECSQDVSSLAALIHDLDLDLPIQVRYDRANPGDSIVIAESWSGLWSMDPVKSVMKR